MPVIYNVTIGPADGPNRFRVTWNHTGSSSENSFEQVPEITVEDVLRLSRMAKFQLNVGQKLFRFLDGGAGYFRGALDRAHRKGEIMRLNLFTGPKTHDWPFELLADNRFLLPHRLHLVRCPAPRGKNEKHIPHDRPLKLLFMACSALDVKPELDFEGEEEAIFQVTANLPIHMDVEDSGTLEGLRRRLEQDAYDVVHLSGHTGTTRNGRSYFIMEDETGYQHKVFPYRLWNEALSENPPRLLFLSGGRAGKKKEPRRDAHTESFARILKKSYNIPVVLEWGKPVKDAQAVHAGKMIFHGLSRGKSIPPAVQRARFELSERFSHTPEPAWPLLRLFAGDVPLPPVVKENQPLRPNLQRIRHVYLGNSRVMVLAQGFVGRRRQLQTGLRALKQDSGKAGVLILGTGGLGKSCLAGKLCERFDDYTLIIVHGKLNAVTMANALALAFVQAQDDGGQQILAQKKTMTNKLAGLCAAAFKEKKYVFLLDDFEQNLEGIEKGQPGSVVPEAADLLKVLLAHLPSGNKNTQLIVTCRYKFSLAHQGSDLVSEHLQKIWLTGFRRAEKDKKARALPHIMNYPDHTLAPRLLAAGRGNPRLMEWVDLLVGQMQEAEVKPLLEAVKNKQEEFIRQHLVRELLRRGGEDLERLLRSLSIYRVPVQLDGVRQVAEKIRLSGWEELLREGMDLSLIEHDQAHRTYQVTPLLREELLPNPKEIVSCHGAALAYYKKESDEVVELDRVMADNDYSKITNQLDSIDPIITEELIHHAIGCGQERIASSLGGVLITHLGNRIAVPEALRIGLWILKEKKKQCCTGNDAFLLSTIAYTYTFLADYHEVIRYSQQALAIFRRVFGVSHPNVTIALNGLGMAYTSLGKNPEAIGYYSEALDITEKSAGKDSLETSQLFNNLGTAYNNQGDYQRAIHHFKRALAICKKNCTLEHHSTVRVLNNIGASYDDLGDYPKAIEYYRRALTISRKMHDETHPTISTALNNLGSIYNKMGLHAEAAGYLEQARSISRDLHEESHPEEANALYNLGVRTYSLGEYTKAIRHFEQALAIWRKAYGQTHPHPQVATVMSSLGLAWSGLGEYKEAIAYFQRALRVERDVYGENHPGLATTLNNLGTAYRTICDYSKAIDNYKQALDMWKKFHKENHPLVATGLNNLGEALISSGAPKEAIGYLQQSLVILRAAFGEEHPNIAGTLNNLGLAYKALARYSEAIESLQQALWLWEKNYGPKHPKVATAMNNLGEVCRVLGEPRKAVDYYQRALDILTEMYGKTHPQVATVLNNLGHVWDALGQRPKAADYYQQALDILIEAYGENHPNVAGLRHNLASARESFN